MLIFQDRTRALRDIVMPIAPSFFIMMTRHFATYILTFCKQSPEVRGDCIGIGWFPSLRTSCPDAHSHAPSAGLPSAAAMSGTLAFSASAHRADEKSPSQHFVLSKGAETLNLWAIVEFGRSLSHPSRWQSASRELRTQSVSVRL